MVEGETTAELVFADDESEADGKAAVMMMLQGVLGRNMKNRGGMMRPRN